MIMDERLEFAKDVVVSGGTGSVYFGDTIDLGPNRDISGSDKCPLFLCIQVTATGAGAGTVGFELYTGSGVADGSGHIAGGAEIVQATRVKAASTYGVGEYIVIPIPQENSEQTYKRYLQMSVRRANASTLLKVSAWINFGYPKHKAYKDADNAG